MTWPGGPTPGNSAAKKITDIRALATDWAAGAFDKPDDQRAQVMGECATMILMVTDP
jgi:hypothetical protein